MVLGITFKENVRDVRNTRVVELVHELENYGIEVKVYDPLVDQAELQKLNLKAVSDPFRPHSPNKPNKLNKPQYDAVVLAVPHRTFREKEPEAYLTLFKDGDGPGVLVDVKGVLPRETIEKARVVYWNI